MCGTENPVLSVLRCVSPLLQNDCSRRRAEQASLGAGIKGRKRKDPDRRVSAHRTLPPLLGSRTALLQTTGGLPPASRNVPGPLPRTFLEDELAAPPPPPPAHFGFVGSTGLVRAVLHRKKWNPRASVLEGPPEATCYTIFSFYRR